MNESLIKQAFHGELNMLTTFRTVLLFNLEMFGECSWNVFHILSCPYHGLYKAILMENGEYVITSHNISSVVLKQKYVYNNNLHFYITYPNFMRKLMALYK